MKWSTNRWKEMDEGRKKHGLRLPFPLEPFEGWGGYIGVGDRDERVELGMLCPDFLIVGCMFEGGDLRYHVTGLTERVERYMMKTIPGFPMRFVGGPWEVFITPRQLRKLLLDIVEKGWTYHAVQLSGVVSG